LVATLSPLPPTATPAPTATPEPLAATVNGQDILLASYERELARCQAGLAVSGQDPSTCPQAVLENLVEQALVEQAAGAAGLIVTDMEVDAAIVEITTELGGPGALEVWLQANGYAPVEFRQALQADLLRARLAEQVAVVSETAEQVHARAILVPAEDTAQFVLGQVQAGADFAALALQYSRDLSSRAAGGDLGWFPRGLLAVPEVEEAAFALQPGETSGVIASALGYHIVQVVEREPARALSPAASQALRAAAYAEWLEARLAEADVQRHINP
jgi:parvulin-like peptidyl-prolyl isomerase